MTLVEKLRENISNLLYGEGFHGLLQVFEKIAYFYDKKNR